MVTKGAVVSAVALTSTGAPGTPADWVASAIAGAFVATWATSCARFVLRACWVTTSTFFSGFAETTSWTVDS